MTVRKFWSTAVLTTIGFALVAAGFYALGPFGIELAADRKRAWLLTMWTSGVLAICFGLSGLLSAVTPIGFSDVAQKGSVLAALEARRDALHRQAGSRFYNFSGWSVATGFLLIGAYFFGWLLLPR